MVKYVKLTAKPNTWFKAGTEVYNYDFRYDECKRVSLDYWNECLSEGGICVRGIRVCEDTPNENGMGCKPGEERVDGEWCSCDEFDVEVVDEPDFEQCERCEQCDEIAWDGYICHICGAKNI